MEMEIITSNEKYRNRICMNKKKDAGKFLKKNGVRLNRNSQIPSQVKK